MRVEVLGVHLLTRECRTRVPFRFGTATMTAAPLLCCALTVRGEDGLDAVGHAADLLPPKWFDKDPDSTVAEDRGALITAVRHAATQLRAAGRGTAFELWLRAERALAEARVHDGAPPALVARFGLALCERALLAAVCSLADEPFHAALRHDRFALRPGEVFREFDGFDLAGALPREPVPAIGVRHTIGMLDRLRLADVPADERVDDGLPQALDEDIAAYDLTRFKVKIGGDRARDLPRLLAIAAVLRERVGDATRWTADGNEQYADLDALDRLLNDLRRHEDGRWLDDRLLFVEQPLPRAKTFDREANALLPRFTGTHAPVILDEADAELGAFARAAELGYRGVSVKSCKGVIRALLDRGLCHVRGGGLFQSGEDLTNLATLPLQQDLVLMSVLGLPDAERNGHHYFPGLRHLEPADADEALAAHPDLYRPWAGGAALRIEHGELRVASLHATGYGDAPLPDLAAWQPV